MSFDLTTVLWQGLLLHLAVSVFAHHSRGIGCVAIAIAAAWIEAPELTILALGQSASWFAQGELSGRCTGTQIGG